MPYFSSEARSVNVKVQYFTLKSGQFLVCNLNTLQHFCHFRRGLINITNANVVVLLLFTASTTCGHLCMKYIYIYMCEGRTNWNIHYYWYGLWNCNISNMRELWMCTTLNTSRGLGGTLISLQQTIQKCHSLCCMCPVSVYQHLHLRK